MFIKTVNTVGTQDHSSKYDSNYMASVYFSVASVIHPRFIVRILMLVLVLSFLYFRYDNSAGHIVIVDISVWPFHFGYLCW